MPMCWPGVFVASAPAPITIALARRVTQHGAAIARQPTDGLFLCAGGKLAGHADKFSTSVWFWVLFVMGASGLLISVIGQFNPSLEITLYKIWLTGCLALAGLMFLIKR